MGVLSDETQRVVLPILKGRQALAARHLILQVRQPAAQPSVRVEIADRRAGRDGVVGRGPGSQPAERVSRGRVVVDVREIGPRPPSLLVTAVTRPAKS